MEFGWSAAKDSDQRIGERIRDLIQNGRWAVVTTDEVTRETWVQSAADGDAANAKLNTILSMKQTARTDHYTEYHDEDYYETVVYRPVDSPLPHCKHTNCGLQMLPQPWLRDKWSGNDQTGWICDRHEVKYPPRTPDPEPAPHVNEPKGDGSEWFHNGHLHRDDGSAKGL